MALDAWLPIGHELPDGARTGRAVSEGAGWQILETGGGGRALVATDMLASRWLANGLLTKRTMQEVRFASTPMLAMSSGPSQILASIIGTEGPSSKAEALSFALALNASRKIDPDSPFQDGIFVEKLSRVLPTFGITSRMEDDVVLGFWLSGGVPISVRAFRRLHQAVGWLGSNHLSDVLAAAGYPVPQVDEQISAKNENPIPDVGDSEAAKHPGPGDGISAAFVLPGRFELSLFINEHVIDILRHRDRYKAMGIEFPSAVVLHGPPGSGKTFAIEKLVEFLQWPSFQIDASSVASPYIHETSKKVAEVFNNAIKNSPSILVIDEMEAFLADREMGSGHHRVEEVAEFLRRIPEAIKNDVLIVAMTNRIEMIDPAVLRRGRFDHVVRVDFATEEEIRELLVGLFSSLPMEQDVDATVIAARLAGRPLSDVTFVVREGARLAARSGKGRLDNVSLLAALESTPVRSRDGEPPRRIGFV